MKKNIFLFIFSFFLLIMLASCRRTWVIEIDGYILHEINEKYHIAQIPQEVANQDYYEVPAYIGEYEIYGFGSNRVYGMWGGEEHLELGNIRKLKINSNIHSLYFDHFSPLLIETERPLSEMYINIELFLTYFLSPKEDLEYFDYVDASDCYDGIVYEIKEDGNVKVLFNYSNNFTIQDEYNGSIVNEIGDYAFMNSKVDEITIPVNINTIGDYAFHNCSLKNVTFNENISEIGDYAFNINNIKELQLPNVELIIGKCAFKENDIQHIEIPENILEIKGAAFSNNEIESFKFESEYIKIISSQMFMYCPLTGDLDFGTHIQVIQDDALSGNQREELIIPDTIISFGNLSYCRNLKRIFLPETSITIGIFSYLANLEELHLGGATQLKTTNPSLQSTENLRLITVSDNNLYYYTYNGVLYDRSTNAIVKCPPKLELKTIEINVKPYERAFLNNSYLEEVIINCDISESTFFYCTNLKKVELNSRVNSIPTFAFTGCTSLKEINLKNVTEIADKAFLQCESLTYVDLSNCKVVGRSAFEKCDLHEVVFTEKIQEIKQSAFANNKNLETCDCFNATIGKNAFYDTPLYEKPDEEKKETFKDILRGLFHIFFF